MNNGLVFLTFFAMLSLLGCSSGGPGDSVTLARINDYDLSLEEFQRQLSDEISLDAEFKVDETVRGEFLEQIIRKELLIQEAVKLKLDRKEEFIRAIERYWEATLIRNLMDAKTREIGSKAIVTQEDIKAHYEKLSKEAALPPFTDMEEVFRGELQDKKKTEMIGQWISDLRKNAKVEIDKELLSKNM